MECNVDKLTHSFRAEFPNGVVVTGTYHLKTEVQNNHLTVSINYEVDNEDHSLYTRKMEEVDKLILNDIKNCLSYHYRIDVAVTT